MEGVYNNLHTTGEQLNHHHGGSYKPTTSSYITVRNDLIRYLMSMSLIPLYRHK